MRLCRTPSDLHASLYTITHLHMSPRVKNFLFFTMHNKKETKPCLFVSSLPKFKQSLNFAQTILIIFHHIKVVKLDFLRFLLCGYTHFYRGSWLKCIDKNKKVCYNEKILYISVKQKTEQAVARHFIKKPNIKYLHKSPKNDQNML